jgi:hypothetical protein
VPTRIKIELNAEAFGRLVEAGVAECRPAGMQAEVLLLRSLGLEPEPFTPPTVSQLAPEGTGAIVSLTDDPGGAEAK